jgi:hypothetical protein
MLSTGLIDSSTIPRRRTPAENWLFAHTGSKRRELAFDRKPVGHALLRSGLRRAQDRVAQDGGAVAVFEGGAVWRDLRYAQPSRCSSSWTKVCSQPIVPGGPPPIPERMVGLAHKHRAESFRALADLELVQRSMSNASDPLEPLISQLNAFCSHLRPEGGSTSRL